MSDLSQKKCVPCEGGTKPLSEEIVNQFLPQIPTWDIKDGKVHKKFKFKNFKEAMAFVNKVAEIAQQEGHHPDIYIFYNKVELNLITHAIGGLSENDFIVAAKIDELTI